jgi:intracellular sulfur oxidation DsrE/DsrF family protein
MSLERLHQRGTTFLLCNRATMNAAADMAQRTGRDADAVRQEVRENLIPGAILMPDGIFALIRAQNAGAAYMGGV